MGDGNNEFSILSGGVSNLVMGDGDNTINGGNGLYNVVAGNGNNTVNLLPNSYGGYTNSVKLGDGDNIITVSDGYAVMGIEAGNGNNTVTVSRDKSQRNTAMLQTLKTGSGNDTVTYNSVGYMKSIDVGAGDDVVIIEADNFENENLTVDLGAGKDKITIKTTGSYVVDGGDGIDTMTFDMAKGGQASISNVEFIDILNASSASGTMLVNQGSNIMIAGGSFAAMLKTWNSVTSISVLGTSYSRVDIDGAFAALKKEAISFADVAAYIKDSYDDNETPRIPLLMVAGEGK